MTTPEPTPEVEDLLTRLAAAEESAIGHEFWHEYYQAQSEQGWAKVYRIRALADRLRTESVYESVPEIAQMIAAILAEPVREAGATNRRGWFSDVDREQTGEYIWQPCFETGQGHVPCFELWFASKAECDEWIAENVLGADWLDERS